MFLDIEISYIFLGQNLPEKYRAQSEVTWEFSVGSG